MDRLDWLAEDDVDMKREMYQVFGTSMLNRLFYGMTQDGIESRFGCTIRNLPLSVILPIAWKRDAEAVQWDRVHPPRRHYRGPLVRRVHRRQALRVAVHGRDVPE